MGSRTHYYSVAAIAPLPRNGSSLSYLSAGYEESRDSTPPADRRNKRGLVYKSRNDQEYKLFQDEEGCSYRVGDHVFIETLQPSEPYLIGSILMFKMTKRSDLLVKVSATIAQMTKLLVSCVRVSFLIRSLCSAPYLLAKRQVQSQISEGYSWQQRKNCLVSQTHFSLASTSTREQQAGICAGRDKGGRLISGKIAALFIQLLE
uniref:BAH domain-containing protein n=1 Tax=Ditylenchus dipsaci TaxID=166011 RepID=A0A915D4X5_9BILA